MVHFSSETFVIILIVEKNFKKNSLRVHQKNHSNNELFSCDQQNCKYRTNIKNNLIIHKIKHSNERPFSCTTKGCLESVLKSHLWTHSIDL
jgi:hypothetical protein